MAESDPSARDRLREIFVGGKIIKGGIYVDRGCATHDIGCNPVNAQIVSPPKRCKMRDRTGGLWFRGCDSGLRAVY